MNLQILSGQAASARNSSPIWNTSYSKINIFALATLLSIFAPTSAIEGVENPVFDFVSGPNGKSARLTWPSQPGVNYLIEKSTDLKGTWNQFDSEQSNSFTTTFIDSSALASRCFYRIREERYSEVAFYGDSITDQSYVEAGTSELRYIYLTAPAAWARAYLENRFELIPRSPGLSHLDFGYSGATIANLANGATYAGVRPMSVLLGRSPQIVVELSGTNDVVGYYGVIAANVAAARVANWDYMLSHGVKRVIALAIPPMDANYIGALQTELIDSVNGLLANAAAGRSVTWVPYPVALKSAGKADPRYFRDGIHPNHVGAQFIGRAVATALDPFVQTKPFVIPADGDAAWLTGNPYLTGGTTMATGWISRFGMVGVTASKVVNAEGQWQRLAITGATENSHGGSDFVIWQGPASTAYIAAGTRVRVVARMRARGLHGVKVRAIMNDDNRGAGFNFGTGFASTGSYPLSCSDNTLTWVGPVVTIGPGAMPLNIWIQPLGNGTLDMRQCGVVKVP